MDRSRQGRSTQSCVLNPSSEGGGAVSPGFTFHGTEGHPRKNEEVVNLHFAQAGSEAALRLFRSYVTDRCSHDTALPLRTT
eukprot:185045-Pleurochrysis_carterae.AAC.1